MILGLFGFFLFFVPSLDFPYGYKFFTFINIWSVTIINSNSISEKLNSFLPFQKLLLDQILKLTFPICIRKKYQPWEVLMWRFMELTQVKHLFRNWQLKISKANSYMFIIFPGLLEWYGAPQLYNNDGSLPLFSVTTYSVITLYHKSVISVSIPIATKLCPGS
jgi:hypothetical protein